MTTATPTDARPPAYLGWVVLVTGLGGTLASLVLAVERYLLLTNPFYAPSCDLGAAVSCRDVMSSWQGAVLGFPNPYLGLLAFPVVVTLGVLVVGGTALPHWCWAGLSLGTLAGFGFVLWLMSQSLFVIQAVCPYCVVVWVCVSVLLVHAPRALSDPGGGPLGRTRATLDRWWPWVLGVWLAVLTLLVAVVAAQLAG
ncbi:vitamin K epoxide reductase family protein [uncultured Serinicoccus sp.]|uniref:vitamin K epoxide reductase family protein n=1 Tax=uncultured Serinicoccus sp. TaxID=735514 RepID=UPI0026263FD5|nr:vitamin K epoxide reductase family protein [uncultured Serinicoccus sp.]